MGHWTDERTLAFSTYKLFLCHVPELFEGVACPWNRAHAAAAHIFKNPVMLSSVRSQVGAAGCGSACGRCKAWLCAPLLTRASWVKQPACAAPSPSAARGVVRHAAGAKPSGRADDGGRPVCAVWLWPARRPAPLLHLQPAARQVGAGLLQGGWGLLHCSRQHAAGCCLAACLAFSASALIVVHATLLPARVQLPVQRDGRKVLRRLLQQACHALGRGGGGAVRG